MTLLCPDNCMMVESGILAEHKVCIIVLRAEWLVLLPWIPPFSARSCWEVWHLVVAFCTNRRFWCLGDWQWELGVDISGGRFSANVLYRRTGHRDGMSGVAHIFGLNTLAFAFSFVLFSVSPVLVLVPLSAENSTYSWPSSCGTNKEVAKS